MRLTFRPVPSPLEDGALLVYDPAAAERALEAAARGATVEREVPAADATAARESVMAVQRQLRRSLAGRSRKAWGRALLWFLLGPAALLLLANLLEWLGLFLGAGGASLAVIVLWFLPLIACWQRAFRAVREARAFGRLARAAAGRRVVDAERRHDAGGALRDFEGAVRPQIERLRAMLPRLPESGSDAAGEAADLARQVYFEAARRGLPEVSRHYHALYGVLSGAERRMSRLEASSGGVLSERKVSGEAARALRAARKLFAPYRPGAKPPSHTAAPFAGFALGLLGLALTVLVTGVYWVPDGAAMVIEPLSARFGRLFGAGGAEATGGTMVRDPGFHWTIPYPLTGRTLVSEGSQQSATGETQRIVIRGRLRRASATAIHMVEMQVEYRVADPAVWARLNADGSAQQQLTVRLSRELDSFLQGARQQAANAVAQQNPALANDRAQLQARADQLVEERLREVLQAYLDSVAGSEGARAIGIQVSTEVTARIVRDVPEAEANALFG